MSAPSLIKQTSVAGFFFPKNNRMRYHTTILRLSFLWMKRTVLVSFHSLAPFDALSSDILTQCFMKV